jgi:anaerobic selenocysteine-containing dehydrogenase
VLAQVTKAVAQAKGAVLPGEAQSALAGVEVSEAAKRIADSLVAGKKAGIFLGNLVQHHPAATQLHALAQALSDLIGAKFGFLGEAANSVGGHIANATPASSEQGPAERGAGTRLRDATAEPAVSASVIPAPCASPGSDPKGNPLPPCDAPRLRDANVHESDSALSIAGAASVSGVTFPKGAPVPPSDGAPHAQGLNALQMIAQPRKAYIMLGVEPELDCYDPAQALAAMKQAEFVVALSPYQHQALDYAHALLPIAPFTETSGTFISTEGRVQGFGGVVQPLAETRPAWKVLRVLGNLLGSAGFAYDSSEAVLNEALGSGDVAARLNNRLQSIAVGKLKAADSGIERIGEVPIYQADAIVRRAASLQQTHDAAEPVAAMNGALFSQLGLRDGDKVKITQGSGAAVLTAARDDKLPANCIRAPAAHPLTAGLGGMFGIITAERVAQQQKVAV